MKTKSKIVLLLFVSNVLIVLLFSTGVYYFLNEYSYLDFYKRLETRASIAAKYNLDSDTLNSEALMELRNQHLERLTDEKEYLIKVDTINALNHASQYYALPIDFLETILKDKKSTYKSGKVFFTGITRVKDKSTYIIVVSAENYYASHHLSFLQNILFIGIFFIILITVGLSFYFSRAIFSPIKKITDNVKQISADNMHLRLEDSENNNEISELTSTFNDLLNRMETAFETQKNFISNASHELGTPLTAIIGEADVTLIKERKPEEYKEAMQKILEQAERLNQITKSLLFLAQTGYNDKKIILETVRIDELIWEVKEAIGKLNPNNAIFIDSSLFPDDPKKLKVKGNKQLLRMALANIISNACKYSHNKPVPISIASGQNQVIIIVKDEGVGIPENEIQFIYDPFFRASNTHLFEGYGIGLPLARNIIKLHNGLLQVSSLVNAGTIVQIKLPLLYSF